MQVNSMDILSQMKETRDKLSKGEITVDQAKGEARIYTVMMKCMSLSLEHARETDRLKKGSPIFSSMTMVD